jgi:hypothetical protein
MRAKGGGMNKREHVLIHPSALARILSILFESATGIWPVWVLFESLTYKNLARR